MKFREAKESQYVPNVAVSNSNSISFPFFFPVSSSSFLFFFSDLVSESFAISHDSSKCIYIRRVGTFAEIVRVNSIRKRSLVSREVTAPFNLLAPANKFIDRVATSL